MLQQSSGRRPRWHNGHTLFDAVVVAAIAASAMGGAIVVKFLFGPDALPVGVAAGALLGIALRTGLSRVRGGTETKRAKARRRH